MVYIRHKGGGRMGSDISTMDKIWSAEWLTIDPQKALAGCEKEDTWYWIQQYMKPPMRILEGGCGVGQWVRFLAERGYEAYGLDFSQEAIRVGMEAWSDLRLIQGDLRSMPYEDGYFGGIVSLGAIEHDEKGPQAILREMRRVLAPGGILFCTVPCINYLRRSGLSVLFDWVVCNPTIRRLTGRKPDVAFYEYMWTPREYRRILQDAGFEVLRLVPMSPLLSVKGRPGSLRRRLVEWVHARVPWLMCHMVGAFCRKA
jgi:SAM-dependent methyltransferase